MKFKNMYKLATVSALGALTMACGEPRGNGVDGYDGPRHSGDVYYSYKVKYDTMVIMGVTDYGRIAPNSFYKLADKSGKEFFYDAWKKNEIGGAQGNVVIVEMEKGKVVDILRNLTAEKIQQDFMNGKLR